MAVPLSSWAQQVALLILIACTGFIVFLTQASTSDYTYLFWNRVAPILAMQLVVTPLCMMNGSQTVPGVLILASMGFSVELLWRIYS